MRSDIAIGVLTVFHGDRFRRNEIIGRLETPSRFLLGALAAVVAVVAAAPALAQSTVKLESQTCGTGADVVVPISVTPADGVTAMDFAFTYDAVKLTATAVYRSGYVDMTCGGGANDGKPCQVPADCSGGTCRTPFSLGYDLGAGAVSIHMTGGSALAGNGQVAWVVFHAIGPAGSVGSLTWTSAVLNGGSLSTQTQNGSVTIAAPATVISMSDTAQAAPGATGVRVPVSATPFTGGDSFDLVIQFDQSVVNATGVEKTTLTQSLTLSANTSQPGVVRIVLFGTHTINGPGDLVRIVFNVTGPLGSKTPLDVTTGNINERTIPTTLDDGLFTVCTATDADGDGFSTCAGDCNDGNPNIHPGAAELCNGVDDNCNGSIDEGNPGGGAACSTGQPGVCAAGTTVCSGGSIVCSQDHQPTAETCDGLDNDCDGLADEENPGGGGVCATGQPGVCAAGTTACVGGSIVCNQDQQPTAETCDGLDNDCDGLADEENPGGGGVCATGQPGVCAAGTTACAGGTIVCNRDTAPSAEVCDGLDNDCNGSVDDVPVPVGAPQLDLSGAQTGMLLTWSELAGASGYDIVRGSVSILLGSSGDFSQSTDLCLANDLSGNSIEDDALPSEGDAFWYLVRGVNCAGAGTYDSGAASQVGERDAEIEASDQACP